MWNVVAPAGSEDAVMSAALEVDAQFPDADATRYSEEIARRVEGARPGPMVRHDVTVHTTQEGRQIFDIEPVEMVATTVGFVCQPFMDLLWAALRVVDVQPLGRRAEVAVPEPAGVAVAEITPSPQDVQLALGGDIDDEGAVLVHLWFDERDARFLQTLADYSTTFANIEDVVAGMVRSQYDLAHDEVRWGAVEALRYIRGGLSEEESAALDKKDSGRVS